MGKQEQFNNHSEQININELEDQIDDLNKKIQAWDQSNDPIEKQTQKEYLLNTINTLRGTIGEAQEQDNNTKNKNKLNTILKKIEEMEKVVSEDIDTKIPEPEIEENEKEPSPEKKNPPVSVKFDSAEPDHPGVKIYYQDGTSQWYDARERRRYEEANNIPSEMRVDNLPERKESNTENPEAENLKEEEKITPPEEPLTIDPKELGEKMGSSAFNEEERQERERKETIKQYGEQEDEFAELFDEIKEQLENENLTDEEKRRLIKTLDEAKNSLIESYKNIRGQNDDPLPEIVKEANRFKSPIESKIIEKRQAEEKEKAEEIINKYRQKEEDLINLYEQTIQEIAKLDRGSDERKDKLKNLADTYYDLLVFKEETHRDILLRHRVNEKIYQEIDKFLRLEDIRDTKIEEKTKTPYEKTISTLDEIIRKIENAELSTPVEILERDASELLKKAQSVVLSSTPTKEEKETINEKIAEVTSKFELFKNSREENQKYFDLIQDLESYYEEVVEKYKEADTQEEKDELIEKLNERLKDIQNHKPDEIKLTKEETQKIKEVKEKVRNLIYKPYIRKNFEKKPPQETGKVTNEDFEETLKGATPPEDGPDAEKIGDHLSWEDVVNSAKNNDEARESLDYPHLEKVSQTNFSNTEDGDSPQSYEKWWEEELTKQERESSSNPRTSTQEPTENTGGIPSPIDDAETDGRKLTQEEIEAIETMEKLLEGSSPEEREAENEIEEELEKLPPEEREKVKVGLLYSGLKIKRSANKLMASIIDAGLKPEDLKRDNKLNRFRHAFAETYKKDSQKAEKDLEQIANGNTRFGHKLKNLSPALTVIKGARIVSDVTGVGVVNPLRYFMLGAVASARLSEAGKEARLYTRQVDSVTKAQEKEMREENLEESEALKQFEEKAVESLKERFSDSYKGEDKGKRERYEKIREKVLRDNSQLNKGPLKKVRRKVHNITHNLLKKSHEKTFSKISQKLEGAQNEQEKQKILNQYKDYIKDLDRMTTRYATVDVFASNMRALEKGFKTAGNVLALQSLYMWGSELYENVEWENKASGVKDKFESFLDYFKGSDSTPNVYSTDSENISPDNNIPVQIKEELHSINTLKSGPADQLSNNSDRIVPDAIDTPPKTQTGDPTSKTTIDRFDAEDILTRSDNPPFDPSASTSGTTANRATFPEMINDEITTETPTVEKEPLQKLYVIERSGGEVEYGDKIKIEYDLNSPEGEVKYLDQALRRIVMQAYPVTDHELFSNVEAARLENVLANTREILQGKSLVGFTPHDLKGLAEYKDGKLIISDYEGFSKKILGPLFERAEENIDESSEAVDYAQKTSENNWQKMLNDKHTKEEAWVKADFMGDNSPQEESSQPVDTSSEPIETKASTPSEEQVSSETNSEPVNSNTSESFETKEVRDLDSEMTVETEKDIEQINHLRYEEATTTLRDRYRLTTRFADQIGELAEEGKLKGLTKDGQITPNSELDLLAKLFSGPRETILLDNRTFQIDENQIEIFKTLVKEAENATDVQYAMALTDTVSWTPEKELSLARAIVNRGNIPLWQETFGKDMIPDNANIQILDNYTIRIGRVAGLKGSMEIDFQNKEIFLTKLFNGSTPLSRGVYYSHFENNGDTFSEALEKTKTMISRAKKEI